jgi:hypothetical protein
LLRHVGVGILWTSFARLLALVATPSHDLMKRLISSLSFLAAKAALLTISVALFANMAAPALPMLSSGFDRADAQPKLHNIVGGGTGQNVGGVMQVAGRN